MSNITLDGLPLKTGTVSDAGIVHYRESGVDKKLTISDLIAKFLANNPKLSSIEALSTIANILSLAGLNGSANKSFYFDGVGSLVLADRLGTTTNKGVAFLSNPITISNNATDANNDIDFSAGNAPLDDGSGQVLLSSTLVKRLDASWVAGTNQGGLFSGTKANSTRYYEFAITNGTINDAGFDISPTGANIPAGYKGSYRGMVLTDGSGNIRAFTLAGQYIEYVNDITDYNPSPTSGVFATYTLSCPQKTNILAKVMLTSLYTGAGVVTLATSYRKTGSSANNLFFGGAISGYTAHAGTNFVPLNSSAQIDFSFTFDNPIYSPAGSFTVVTKGYFDFNIKN